MYISELTLISQTIISNLPVFLVVGIMILMSHNGLSKRMDKMDEKYDKMDEKYDRVNQRLDNLYNELISLRKEIK